MNILIAGGSGFIGTKIIESLSEHNFINLSQRRKNDKCSNNLNFNLATSVNHLNLSFTQNIDLIINCIDTKERKNDDIRNNIVESARNLISLAKSNNCKKIIHLSINEAENVKDEYQKAKLLAERAIENSGLEYIILRLSPIFGEGSQIENLVKNILERKRIAQIGSEDDKIAPIHYSDIIRNIEKAIEDKNTWYQTYSLCGPEYMTFNEFLSRYSDKKLKVYKVPKLMERVFVGMVSDDYTKKVAYSIANSYYQDSKYVHSQIVKPKRFY